MKGRKYEKAKLTVTLSIICSLDHDDYVDMIDSKCLVYCWDMLSSKYSKMQLQIIFSDLTQSHPAFIFIGKFERESVAENERLEGQMKGKRE